MAQTITICSDTSLIIKMKSYYPVFSINAVGVYLGFKPVKWGTLPSEFGSTVSHLISSVYSVISRINI